MWGRDVGGDVGGEVWGEVEEKGWRERGDRRKDGVEGKNGREGWIGWRRRKAEGEMGRKDKLKEIMGEERVWKWMEGKKERADKMEEVTST